MDYQDEDDFYTDWEWQPIQRMPGGCNYVTVKYEDGRTAEMCSCDYWWDHAKKYDQPILFRFSDVELDIGVDDGYKTT